MPLFGRFFNRIIWICFIFPFCHLAYPNKMLGLTVRCAVHTNYKPLYLDLELKAALFHGTPLPFSELYIFITFYGPYFILRIMIHFRSIHCFIFQRWDRTPSVNAYCSLQIYTSDSIILYIVYIGWHCSSDCVSDKHRGAHKWLHNRANVWIFFVAQEPIVGQGLLIIQA